MTVTQAAPTTALTPPSILPIELLEQKLGGLSRVVAIACTCGMLFVAGATMIDVVMRWIANEPIPAMNEIVQMIFSVATIAACIPAGLNQRVNLKIDLVARYFSPPVHAWLEVLGGACLWLFYAVLAWGIAVYAGALAEDGKATVILGLPEAPFMYAVAALFGFGWRAAGHYRRQRCAPRGLYMVRPSILGAAVAACRSRRLGVVLGRAYRYDRVLGRGQYRGDARPDFRCHVARDLGADSDRCDHGHRRRHQFRFVRGPRAVP